MKTYMKQDGSISEYDYTNYMKLYNSKRNPEISRLQKLKSYYKKSNNTEKVNELQTKIEKIKIYF